MFPYRDAAVRDEESTAQTNTDIPTELTDVAIGNIDNAVGDYKSVGQNYLWSYYPDIQQVRWNSKQSFWPPSSWPSWGRKCAIVFAAFVFAIVFFAVGRKTSDADIHLPASVTNLASWGAKRKALVVATTAGRNTTWLETVPDDWEVYKYVNDDPMAKYNVPRNQGNEAMPYLTFIIDNYDNLPDYILFTHGHEKAWHQPESMLYIMQALNFNVLDELGWVSLRCTLQNTCESEQKHVRPEDPQWWLTHIFNGLHNHVFRPDDPWYEPMPKELATPCCAQFAATKKQVRSRPLEVWKRLREPLMRDLDKEYASWQNGTKDFSWHVGGTFEISWQYWFGMGGVVCVDTDYCRKTIFQDKIHCNGTTWDWFSIKNYSSIACTLDP